MEVKTESAECADSWARSAGSWRGTWGGRFYAKAGRKKSRWNVRLQADNGLLDIDPKGGSVATHKIKYFVTSPKF
jgi:hypothetical protein